MIVSRGSSSLPDSLLYKLLTKLFKVSYLRVLKDFPLNDVSHSGSQVDPPPGPTGGRGIFRQLALQFYHAPKWIDINVCHFLIHLIKMTSYNTYPVLPSAPPSENPQIGYHLNMVQAKRRGLINKEQMLKKKYEKYTKILN